VGLGGRAQSSYVASKQLSLSDRGGQVHCILSLGLIAQSQDSWSCGVFSGQYSQREQSTSRFAKADARVRTRVRVLPAPPFM
jgi:hypothetical protein